MKHVIYGLLLDRRHVHISVIIFHNVSCSYVLNISACTRQVHIKQSSMFLKCVVRVNKTYFIPAKKNYVFFLILNILYLWTFLHFACKRSGLHQQRLLLRTIIYFAFFILFSLKVGSSSLFVGTILRWDFFKLILVFLLYNTKFLFVCTLYTLLSPLWLCAEVR